jgi:hypothetical protein
LAVIGAVALTIFGLWFMLDPDPNAIWQDFVLRENVGKVKSHGYLSTLLWSRDGMWKMLPAYPVNAGLLAIAVVALFYVAYKNRFSLSDGEKLLWMCVLTYLVVFTFPSHRSERYLLPAMPALAILLALNWNRLPRLVLGATAVLAGVLVAALTYVSISLQASIRSAQCYPIVYWIELAITAALIVGVLFVPRLARSSLLMVIFLVYLCFSGFMRPLDGSLGTYSADVRDAVRDKELWVPSRSNGREEGYRFQLPAADLHSYNYELQANVSDLIAKYPLVVVRLSVKDKQTIPGTILGQRLDLSSNHNSKQMIEMATGHVADHLFVRELVIARGTNGP